jgi:hypothetical protein
LRLEGEADVVPVAEEPMDEGESDEGRAPRDADGARLRGALRRALGRAGAPPARASEQQRGAHLLHLRLHALRAPQHPHGLASPLVRAVE